MHEINWPASLRLRLCGVATLALSIGLAVPALAQQAPTTIRLLPEDAQRGLNGHQHNFYFLPPGVDGEKYVNAGFFGQHLRPYLGDNVDALANLNLYKRQKTTFLIDRIIAVGAFGVYGQQIFSEGEAVYFNNTQKVAVGMFVTSMLATIFINERTNSYMQRVVGSFNGMPGRGALWPRLRPTGVGIGQAPTGQAQLSLRWAVR